jgi:hypothetical protein
LRTKIKHALLLSASLIFLACGGGGGGGSDTQSSVKLSGSLPQNVTAQAPSKKAISNIGDIEQIVASDRFQNRIRGNIDENKNFDIDVPDEENQFIGFYDSNLNLVSYMGKDDEHAVPLFNTEGETIDVGLLQLNETSSKLEPQLNATELYGIDAQQYALFTKGDIAFLMNSTLDADGDGIEDSLGDKQYKISLGLSQCFGFDEVTPDADGYYYYADGSGLKTDALLNNNLSLSMLGRFSDINTSALGGALLTDEQNQTQISSNFVHSFAGEDSVVTSVTFQFPLIENNNTLLNAGNYLIDMSIQGYDTLSFKNIPTLNTQTFFDFPKPVVSIVPDSRGIAQRIDFKFMQYANGAWSEISSELHQAYKPYNLVIKLLYTLTDDSSHTFMMFSKEGYVEQSGSLTSIYTVLDEFAQNSSLSDIIIYYQDFAGTVFKASITDNCTHSNGEYFDYISGANRPPV